MNFARLNHIWVPQTKVERDKLRQRKGFWFLERLFFWVFQLSDTGRYLVLFWAVCGVGSINVSNTQLYYLWSAVTGLLLAGLLLRRFFKLKDVSFIVHTPKRIIAGQNMVFDFTLTNQGNKEYQSIGIRGPFLPWDGKYQSPLPFLAALKPGQSRSASLEIQFIKRGEHHLDVFTAFALVPLSIAIGPVISSNDVRFLVVPKIANVVSFNTPLQVRYQPGGVALASRIGESRELLGVRQYMPGDPVRDIHAKSWARLGQPVVREYQQEYFTRIGIVVDTDLSASSEPVFEAALSLGAGLVSHFSRGEALIDLLVLGKTVHQLSLGRSLGFLEQALDLLACVTPGSLFDLAELESRLILHLQRLSCVVFVTLEWTPARQQFSKWIETCGVACRVLQVVDKKTSTQPKEHTTVTVAQINDHKEIHL